MSHKSANEQTRCHLTQIFTHLRFNVNTCKACKIEKLGSCQKHTHRHSAHGAPSLPDQGKTRALFLARATLFPVLAPDE